MNEYKKLKLLFISILFIMFSYGVFVNITGSLSVSIMDYYAIDTAKRGFMLTIQALGGLFIVLFLIFWGERLNKLILFSLGMLLMGVAGLTISGIASLSFYMVLLFFLGGGIYTVDTLSNSVVSDIYREKQSKYLLFIHQSYSIGAVLSNVIVLKVISGMAANAWKTVYQICGFLAIFTFLFIGLAIYFSRGIIPYKNKRITPAKENQSLKEILKMPETWLVFFCITIYSCAYATITTWLPYQWEKVLNFSKEISTIALSIFFIGFLIIRFISPFLLRKFSPKNLICTASIIGGISITLAAIAPIPLLAMLFVLIGGFMLGGVFPLYALVVCRIYPQRTSFASSLLLLAVSLTMISIPWVTGELAKTVGMTLPLVLSCGCLVLSSPVILLVKEKDKPQAQPRIMLQQEIECCPK